MEWFISLLGILADLFTNGWVYGTITALLTVAVVVLKIKHGTAAATVDRIKAVLPELRHAAEAYKAAKDPKGEAGTAVSPAEQARLEKELYDVLGAVLAVGGLSLGDTAGGK